MYVCVCVRLAFTTINQTLEYWSIENHKILCFSMCLVFVFFLFFLFFSFPNDHLWNCLNIQWLRHIHSDTYTSTQPHLIRSIRIRHTINEWNLLIEVWAICVLGFGISFTVLSENIFYRFTQNQKPRKGGKCHFEKKNTKMMCRLNRWARIGLRFILKMIFFFTENFRHFSIRLLETESFFFSTNQIRISGTIFFSWWGTGKENCVPVRRLFSFMFSWQTFACVAHS